jgi:hypothetical protein
MRFCYDTGEFSGLNNNLDSFVSIEEGAGFQCLAQGVYTVCTY